MLDVDVFSPFVPRPIYINNLPPLSALDLPVDIIIYLVLGVLIVFFLIKKQKEYIKKVIIILWVTTALLYTLQSGIQAYAESVIFGGKSLDELRNITTSNNFYNFLKFAQTHIPNDQPVTLILPKDPPYFHQKAPYYLYPHPIKNDALYILVFNAPYVKFNQEEQELIIDGRKEIINAKLRAKLNDNEYILLRNTD